MSDELIVKRCLPCEGGIKPLNDKEIESLLAKTPAWELNTAGEIERVFKFKNYYHTIAFVNAIAWMAHHENHHPDLEVGYDNCRVRYSTHAIQGLSENDFICASKVNKIFQQS